MLYEIMKYCRNYFVCENHEGSYSIVSNTISLPFLGAGQYFLIEGSTYNDGVYQYTSSLNLANETFKGNIASLAFPKDFLQLVSDIEAWQTANAGAISSPYQSESFGGYSYTKANGKSICWQNQFADRLKIWRKL